MKSVPCTTALWWSVSMRSAKSRRRIVIPDNVAEKPDQGEVIAVGKGKISRRQVRPLDVKVGDRILFGKFSGQTVKSRAPKYLVMREDDIMGVVASRPTTKFRSNNVCQRRTFSRTRAAPVLAGVNILADRRKGDASAQGRNVMLERSYGAPTVTKDGVSVAKEIETEGQVREHGRADGEGSRSKTSDVAGDGTTTQPCSLKRS